MYYILVTYNTINTNEHYDWGQAPKPPFQFVIHKSIVLKILVGDSAVLPKFFLGLISLKLLSLYVK